jgi:hypothetical protein
MMGIVILISLFDQHKNSKLKCRDDTLSSREIFLSTLKMFKDTKCLLLLVIVVFVGLEQGFMFSDFTKVSIWSDIKMTIPIIPHPRYILSNIIFVFPLIVMIVFCVKYCLLLNSSSAVKQYPDPHVEFEFSCRR